MRTCQSLNHMVFDFMRNRLFDRYPSSLFLSSPKNEDNSNRFVAISLTRKSCVFSFNYSLENSFEQSDL